MSSSLSSPFINVHSYEWKCLRFWYFIGANDDGDWHTTSLMLLLRTLTSNQTNVLFFADEVTDKARYTQIPLPKSSTNAQVSYCYPLKYISSRVNLPYFDKHTIYTFMIFLSCDVDSF